MCYKIIFLYAKIPVFINERVITEATDREAEKIHRLQYSGKLSYKYYLNQSKC